MALPGLITVFGELLSYRPVQRALSRMQAVAPDYRALSDARIRDACAALVDAPKVEVHDDPTGMSRIAGYDISDQDADALALASEAFSRFPPEPLVRGVRPYAEQTLASLHLLRGSLVQMDTGEGKTFAIMLAAVALLRRHPQVVIITANPYLASRDAAACSGFWHALGIGVGLVLPDTYRTTGWPAWESAVVYATPETYMFSRLEADIQALAADRHGDNAAVLIDEVDSVLLEKLAGNAQLVRYIAPAAKDWSTALALAGGLGPADIERITGEVAARLTDQGETAVVRGLGPHASAMERLHLMHDVELAYAAVSVAVEGHDYRVTNGTLIAIDAASGWPMTSSSPSWLAPLEQARGLSRRPVKAPTHLGDQLSLLRAAPHVAGTSGTVVGETVDYFLLLNTSVVAIRPRRPRQQEKIPERYFFSLDFAVTHAVDLASRAVAERPVLIICGTTHEAELVTERIRSAVAADVEVRYAVAETIAGERMFEGAGRPGVVVVSTRAAGRGVDIQLTEAARTSGGTLLIMLGHAAEARIDRQVQGRVGREGDPYGIAVLNYLGDPIMRQLTFPISGIWEQAGPYGLENAVTTSMLHAFQATQRRIRLLSFAMGLTSGDVQAGGQRFLSAWYRRLQADGTKDACGPRFLETVSSELAQRIVPQTDGRALTSVQARTIVTRVTQLVEDPAQAPGLEVRITGRERDDALSAVSEILTDRLRKAVQANEAVTDDGRERQACAAQLRQMLAEVVTRIVDEVPDDADSAVVLDHLGTECPHDVGLTEDDVEPVVRPGHGPDRALLCTMVLDDARAAYRRREAEIDALIGELGGMRELEWQVLEQVARRPQNRGLAAGDPETVARVAREVVGYVLTVSVTVSAETPAIPAPRAEPVVQPDRTPALASAPAPGAGTATRSPLPAVFAGVGAPELPPGAVEPAPDGPAGPTAPAAPDPAPCDPSPCDPLPCDPLPCDPLPCDTASFLNRIRVLAGNRTSRLIARETIAGTVASYDTESFRRVYGVRSRNLPARRYQFALAEAIHDLCTLSEAQLIEHLYRNLVRAGCPDDLDALFLIRDNAVRGPRTAMETPWSVEPPPVVSSGTRHRAPTGQAELILYFAEAVEARGGRHTPRRELVLPALEIALRDCPLERLDDPRAVATALDRWKRSAERTAVAMPWRRRALDRLVIEFLDFLHEQGLAAPRPRGVRAAGREAVRRIGERVTGTQSVVGAASLGVALALGVVLAFIDVGARPVPPGAFAVLDEFFAGGAISAGRALGYAMLPTTVAAFVMWLRNGVESQRGAWPAERMLMSGLSVASAAWFVLSAPEGPSVVVVLTAVLLLAAAYMFRNITWTTENLGQTRVLAGLVVLLATLTGLRYLPEVTGTWTVAGTFVAGALLTLVTLPLRRGQLRVQALLLTSEDDTEILVAPRRVTARVGWQGYTFATVVAWLIGASVDAGRVVTQVVQASSMLAVLLVLVWATTRAATSEATWRSNLRSAKQALDPSPGGGGLGSELGRLRRRLAVREGAAVTAVVGVAVAGWWLGGGSDSVAASPVPVELLAVSLAVVACDLGRVFLRNMVSLVSSNGGRHADVSDDVDLEIVNSVQQVGRTVMKYLSVPVAVFLALKFVADILGVWDIVESIWNGVRGLFS